MSVGTETLELDEIFGGARLKRKAEPGVYFLLQGARVMYVGQSKWVHARLCEHVRAEKIIFDRYFVLLCKPSELTTLESIYLHKFKPPHNRLPRHDRSGLDIARATPEIRQRMEKEAARIANMADE